MSGLTRQSWGTTIAVESVKVLQDRIKLYEEEMPKLLKLIVEIDDKRGNLSKAEKRLEKLSSDEAELENDKSLINRQLLLIRESRDVFKRKLSRARSEASVKRLTEAFEAWGLEVQVYESYMMKVNCDLKALADEMQPLKLEASRLGAELENLIGLRNRLFDSLTNSSILVTS